MFSPYLRVAWVLASTCILAIILYESTQAKGQPGVLSLTTNEAYAGHFAVYCVLAFATMVAIGRRSLGGIALVILLIGGLGIALELYQSTVPTRTASTLDALADAGGAACGVLAYLTARSLFSPARSEATKP